MKSVHDQVSSRVSVAVLCCFNVAGCMRLLTFTQASCDVDTRAVPIPLFPPIPIPYFWPIPIVVNCH